MATLKEIAQAAEVSIRTVRRVLNNDVHVKPDKVKKVQAVLAKTGYVPNMLARGLRIKRTGIIGIIASQLDLEVRTKKFSAIKVELSTNGYGSMLGLTDGKKEVENQLCQEYTRFCDGIIFLNEPGTSSLEIIASAKTPFAISDSYLRTPQAVAIDRESGVFEAILNQQDYYETFLFLTNTPGKDEQRRVSFNKGIAAINAKKSKIIFCKNGLFDGGLKAATEVAKYKNSLAVCYNDRIAAGLLKGLFLASCNVPDDYGIIGFDNDSFTEYTHKSISTVTQSVEELAKKTFSVLQTQIEGGNAPETSPVETKFIPRETTI